MTTRGLILGLALVGCNTVDPTVCPDEVPTLTLLATPDTTLEDGDDTQIVFGPQGGYHVGFGIQVQDPARSYTLRTRVRHDGELLADTPYEGPFRGREGCMAVMMGFWAFLDQGPLAEDPTGARSRLVGEVFTLEVDLETESGSEGISLELTGTE